MTVDVKDLIENIEISYVSFKLFFSTPDFQSKLLEIPISKSTDKANRFRNDGNTKFKLNDNYAALTLYTVSVSYAFNDTVELALAYANRSAVLLRLCTYASCLFDINRALAGKYPEHLRAKLHDCKKLCLTGIRREENRRKASETDQIRLKGDETDPIDKNDIPREWVSVLKNQLLPNTSTKIKLECDEKWGRHYVATNNIKTGEILTRQEFFSSMLRTDRQHTNCAHCFLRSDALVPCHTCSMMMYCSEACRAQAFDTYHRIECKMWPYYIAQGITDANVILAARTLLIGTEQGTLLKTLMEKMEIQDIFVEKTDPTNKVYKTDYLSLLQLCRTFDERLEEKTVEAVGMIVMLEKYSFFEKVDDGASLKKEIQFAASLLVNHLLTVKSQFCNFEITEYTNLSRINNVGGGICSLHSFTNHSCNPNAISVSKRREHFLFSLRPIKKGEQIFISYCVPYAEISIDKRKKWLKKLGMTDCQCIACINKWPLSDDMDSSKIEFLTKSDKIKKDIWKAIDVLRKNEIGLNDPRGPRTKYFEILLKFREVVDGNLKLPCYLIANIEIFIGTLLHKLFGNFCTDERMFSEELKQPIRGFCMLIICGGGVGSLLDPNFWD